MSDLKSGLLIGGCMLFAMSADSVIDIVFKFFA